MKRILCILIAAVLLLGSVTAVSATEGTSAIEDDTNAAVESPFYPTAELLKLREHIEDDADMDQYATVQGGCCDGEYAYFAVQDGSTTLLKYDLNSWELVKKQENVEGLGHANDMAYNAKKKTIFVANNGPDYDVLTTVDPETLEVTGSVKLKLKVYSVAYNEEKDIYVVGISGGYKFATLDKNFKVIKKYKGEETGYLRQGCDCDSDYIYFTQSGGDNIVAIYNYKGEAVDIISLGHSHEVENLFHSGGDYYTTLHYYGNTVFRVGMSDDTGIRFSVYYDPGEGEGEMEPTAVHYGESTSLRKNSFTREGYFFGGWKASRSMDSKVLAYRKFASDYEWLDEDEVYEYYLYKDSAAVSRTVKYGSVTLTPFWINKEYDVRYEAEDADGWMQTDTVAYVQNYRIPENAFSMTGYVFIGFHASRDCDGRVYGYRGNSRNAEWLEKADCVRRHLFSEGETFSRMSYDGAITMTPVFSYAYTFSDDGRSLLSYVGYDETVEIPSPTGRLDEIASGAFADNHTTREVIIPVGVKTVGSGAFDNCTALKRIVFSGRLPDGFADDAIVDSGVPEPGGTKRTIPLFEQKGIRTYFLGFYNAPRDMLALRNASENLAKTLAR